LPFVIVLRIVLANNHFYKATYIGISAAQPNF